MGLYKYSFRRKFRSAIKLGNPYTTVLDIAAANAKFRKYFSSDSLYLGADISPEAFAGLEEDSNTKFVVGDIASRPFFLAGRKFDLVVSTHTFAHLAPEDKVKALENLSTVLTENSGLLILQLTDSDRSLLQQTLTSLFVVARYSSYKGVMSRLLESRVGADTWRSGPGLALAWATSWVDIAPHSEYLLSLRLRPKKP